MKLQLLITAYLIIINLIGIIVTVSDKRKAQKKQWRISESTLLLIGLLGGAFCEYFTMLKIRHKTKHTKFMILLPAEMLLHIAIIVIIIFKVAF